MIEAGTNPATYAKTTDALGSDNSLCSTCTQNDNSLMAKISSREFVSMTKLVPTDQPDHTRATGLHPFQVAC